MSAFMENRKQEASCKQSHIYTLAHVWYICVCVQPHAFLHISYLSGFSKKPSTSIVIFCDQRRNVRKKMHKAHNDGLQDCIYCAKCNNFSVWFAIWRLLNEVTHRSRQNYISISHDLCTFNDAMVLQRLILLAFNERSLNHFNTLHSINNNNLTKSKLAQSMHSKLLTLTEL